MKRLCHATGILLLATSLFGAGNNSSDSKGSVQLEPGIAARIATAKDQIAKAPSQPETYTALALAFIKAARATDHADYLKEAEKAASDALRISPGDFEAQKAEVAIRIAESRYTEALELAQSLNKKVPDDNLMYGYIADVDMALGNYQDALKATQWMVDLHAVNAPALQRGAELRESFGYGEAALDWWNSSFRITSFSDVEERAWIMVNMSRVSLRMGRIADAEKDARQALELVANYPWAHDALAAALLSGEGAGEKANEAVSILERRLIAAPNVRTEYYLATALEIAGKKSEAEQAAKRFEKDAVAISSHPYNANQQLVEYYASHSRVADAVTLAASEAKNRQDIETLSSYALALVADGKYDEARTQMDRALAPGIKDAKLFYRAGLIAAKLNDKASAAKYLKKAIEINASSPEAGQAMKLLANMS